MMATSTVPPGLAEALGHMQRIVACPEEVRAVIAALRVPAEEVSGTRGGMTTNWRAAAAGGPAGGSGGWGRRDGRGGGGRHGGGGGGWNHGGDRHHHRSDGPPPPRRPYSERAATIPRFGNKARTDATVEDRMMDRIRDKMNKFSPMTYDATRGWLTQLLDSGETDFLSGFMELVFEKAASEPPFTALYARLLTELRSGFPHIDVELRRIFEAFLSVFAEAAEEPDAASAEYAAYLTLRERRKFRRGYAAFLADVAARGALTSADIRNTCALILTELETVRVAEGKQHLCEEYADCLGSLLKGCVSLVRRDIGPLLTRIQAAKERGAPSLSNKARFALLDLVELFA